MTCVIILSLNSEVPAGFPTNVQLTTCGHRTGPEENQNSGHSCRRRPIVVRRRNEIPLLNRTTSLTHPRSGFQKGDLPTGKTTVMDKFVTDCAPGPASPKHGFVPIEILPAHSAQACLNGKRHRLPVAASFSNTHRAQYSEATG